MNAAGSSVALKRALFPQGFGAEVMLIVQETWRAFSPHQDVYKEEPITALFYDVLKEAYVDAGRQWIVSLEDPITDPIYGTEIGRNDLRFYPPEHYGKKIYFAVECKRLHVMVKSGFKHLADEYVKKGLQRFVDGKYSTGLPCGGMIGYVMDNQLDTAFSRVQSEINKYRSKLKMRGKNTLLVPSSVLPSCTHSADTLHTRSDGELIIHHLLVGISHSADSD